jgi:geranylgeranyl pyrophosphate synthase
MRKEFETYLRKEQEKINIIIEKQFQDVIAAEEEPYLQKFFNFDRDFVLRGGRRLLPISLIKTFIGLSSDKDIAELVDQVYEVSTCIEMLHISSMIEDDLIGDEELRRGLPTFHRYLSKSLASSNSKITPNLQKYAQASAMYGGMLTSFLGFQIIGKSHFDDVRKNRAMQVYREGLQGVTRGHLLNESYKLVPLEEITLENYLILAGLKRGMQMETAVGLGAILGNARQTQMEPLMQAMNKIGIIEQLINDINGSFGDPKKKSTDSDITSGQCTILTTIAFQSASPEQRKVLNATLGNEAATPEEIKAVKDIFIQTNAVEFAKYYANSLKNDAYNLLTSRVYPGLRKEIMDFFEKLLDFIMEYSG